jgi:hypothetical protein
MASTGDPGIPEMVVIYSDSYGVIYEINYENY